MPQVSVVIPCYNHGIYLDEAVASIQCQTFTDIEILVVNDGSTDPFTCRLLADYNRPGTRVIHTANNGVVAARNRGIEEGTGEYILSLDADDRIAPTYIERAVSVLDAQPEVGIVHCQAELYGHASGVWQLPKFSLPHQLLDNVIFSAALFRREDWRRVGGYDEAMHRGWEDWEFWLSLLEIGREVVRLPETLFFYRIRHDSRDRSLGWALKCLLMGRMLIKHRQLYRKYLGEIIRILVSRTRRCPVIP